MLLCASNPYIKEVVNQLFQPRKLEQEIVLLVPHTKAPINVASELDLK